MARLVLALLVLAVASAQTYSRTYTYATNANCGGNGLIMRAKQETCTPGPQGACTANTRTDCVNGVPGSFGGAVSITLHNTATCSDQPRGIISWANGVCVQSGADSWSAFCYAGYFTVLYFINTNVCVGQAYVAQWAPAQCHAVQQNNPVLAPWGINATNIFSQCTPPCFHESQEVVHNGKTVTLPQLEKGEHAGHCTVPHVIQANGVRLETDCGGADVRVTNDHLLYTPKGVAPADSLSVGDTLYGDLSQKTLCKVTKITAEYNQRYFGLNCAGDNSDVLINGHVKASLFGGQHAVPETYFKFATKVLSIEHASTIGEGIVKVLTAFGYKW